MGGLEVEEDAFDFMLKWSNSSNNAKRHVLLLWDILDEFIDERDKEMSALVNLINVSKATNCKIKFPYWKLPITSDKSVHPSPYESYLQDTYNNDLNGKPHTTNQPQFSG